MASAVIEYPAPGLIHGKIIDILVEAGAVGKDQVNKDQGFNFRGIDAVVNSINPLLKKHRVAVLPTKVTHTNVERFENANKKIVTDAVVVVEYTWIAEDGSTFKTEAQGQGRDFADKAVAKASSVAFRTLLIQSLALPTDAPDPDADSIEITTSTPAPEKKPAVKPAPAVNDVAGLKARIKSFESEDRSLNDVLSTGDAIAKRDLKVNERSKWTENAEHLAHVLKALEAGEV